MCVSGKFVYYFHFPYKEPQPIFHQFTQFSQQRTNVSFSSFEVESSLPTIQNSKWVSGGTKVCITLCSLAYSVACSKSFTMNIRKTRKFGQGISWTMPIVVLPLFDIGSRTHKGARLTNVPLLLPKRLFDPCSPWIPIYSMLIPSLSCLVLV